MAAGNGSESGAARGVIGRIEDYVDSHEAAAAE